MIALFLTPAEATELAASTLNEALRSRLCQQLRFDALLPVPMPRTITFDDPGGRGLAAGHQPVAVTCYAADEREADLLWARNVREWVGGGEAGRGEAVCATSLEREEKIEWPT